jgi:predicted transcriptional regulator
MSISAANPQDYLDILLATEVRVDLMTLFHKNPGIMDTSEGIARRIGYLPEAVQTDLDEISKLGVITKRKMGQREIYFLNHARDKEVQDSIGSFLQSMKPSA